ncbi:auxin-responsive protein SAUR36 [Cinnamomum micranthum f. kanehirae]|uniref:Auxin-responsive protein SAUR36 n=1 Tax=Cinnamomum micranthum f. kanehirae TaxID=337451 RepID=A0A3S3PF17_9MAGN|nr:auxin-responsive protein SAUR36 [Cinnamomum micranthum f. kanehirae]
MKRTSRGLRFPLGRKMVKLWKWVLLKPKQNARGYSRLNPQVSGSARNKMMTKICNWGRCLRRRLCPAASKDSFLDRKPVVVPKGHLAVYVGEKEADTHRYLVPVIYFNHPLFAELLREAEEEFGFDHSGGITIPCRVAEFESVRTRIAGERGLPLARRLYLS